MFETKDNKRIVFRAILTIGIIIWSFAVIRYGYFVDENGLLTIYKGIYQGQRMFVDSWEALQTGGLLAYPLLTLYYQVLSPLFVETGINVGLVLYMRYCYVFVRVLVSLYVYYTFKNSDYEEGAYPAALFYFMFVVVWKNFSYKSYCDLAIMLIVCFIFRFYVTRKPRFAAFTAVAACVAVLAYPTMIIMAILLGVYWLLMVINDESPRSSLIAYIVVCLVIGSAVAIYLQLTTGWGNIIAQLPHLGDQDYDDPLYIRFGKILVSYAAFAVAAYLPIAIIRVIDNLRGIAEETERALLTLYFVLFMGAAFLLRVESISTSRFVYGCLIIFFWFPYFLRNREHASLIKIGAYGRGDSETKALLWTVFAISAITQLIWSVSTNQDITVPGYMSVSVVIIMILLFSEEEFDYRGIIAALLVLGMFFNGIWVADSNGGFCHVFEKMYYVERGELKGLALPEDEYLLNETVMNLLEDQVTESDKLLVAFGANSAGYLNSDAKQGTYSVYARPQTNRMIIDYYELNPDNMADYMLIDKGHAKYERYVNTEAGQYLDNLFNIEVASEGNLVLYAREKQEAIVE